MTRIIIDKLLRAGIKLCMLTGVAFTFAACYAPAPGYWEEPEYEEGADSSDISQYPLEDVLDKFYVAVEDFYPELNDGSSNVCYFGFTGSAVEDIEKLLQIVGKHVYNGSEEKDGKTYIKLFIE